MAVSIAITLREKLTGGTGLELLGSQQRHKHTCYCVRLSL